MFLCRSPEIFCMHRILVDLVVDYAKNLSDWSYWYSFMQQFFKPALESKSAGFIFTSLNRNVWRKYLK